MFADDLAASPFLVQPNTTITLKNSKMQVTSKLKANIGHPQPGEKSYKQSTRPL